MSSEAFPAIVIDFMAFVRTVPLTDTPSAVNVLTVGVLWSMFTRYAVADIAAFPALSTGSRNKFLLLLKPEMVELKLVAYGLVPLTVDGLKLPV